MIQYKVAPRLLLKIFSAGIKNSDDVCTCIVSHHSQLLLQRVHKLALLVRFVTENLSIVIHYSVASVVQENHCLLVVLIPVYDDSLCDGVHRHIKRCTVCIFQL